MAPQHVFLAAVTVVLTASVSASAADAPQSEIAPPIAARYAAAQDEVPDFRRHVVPLIGRVGCNGRACHGSFQGQGGFRLSLFGYDFEMDHTGLTSGEEPRVNTKTPVESLILRKATETEPHEGGTRFDLDSWQYRVMLRWIEGGAKGVTDKHANLERLDVQPADILFESAGQTAQLRIVAEWSDGTREDVTPLCRFQSNNDEIAKISEQGVVTSGAAGDTHVVVFYDKGVVPIPVMRPNAMPGLAAYPDVPAPTEIDRLVLQKLRKLQIVPSELSSDAEFLRRVSLDITGSLPTTQEVEQFLADASPTKRSKKIDELLERPTYAAWWANRLCDFTGNSDAALNNVVPKQLQASRDWYEWINRRVEKNVPYDEIAAGIVLAVSRKPDESYEDYCRELCEIYAKDSTQSFADREHMPHYWARRTVAKPEDKALSLAYSFLGIRIQCAQCHKHPFDQWTQQDYTQFANLFSRMEYGLQPDARKIQQTMIADLGLGEKKGGERQRAMAQLLDQGKVVPVLELFNKKPRPAAAKAKGGKNAKNAKIAKKGKNKNKQKAKALAAAGPAKTAKLLGGEVVDLQKYDDPRQAVMDWMRDAQNPYFARAFVNRVWAAYFNVGIVEPPDDLSLANPPSNKELLDYLTDGFVQHGFDMKWLHREIANSRTYQLSWKPNDTNTRDERNFSRAVVRRLPAEVCYDAIQQATAADTVSEAMQRDVAKRAIAVPGTARGGNREVFYALTVFGRSTRGSNCECDRSNQVNLLQTVFTRNDDEIYKLIDRPKDGWLAEICVESGLKVPKPAAPAKKPAKGAAKGKAVNPDKQRRQLTARIAKLKEQGKEKDATRLAAKLKQVEKRIAQAAKQKDVQQVSVVTEPAPPPKPLDIERIVTQAYLRTLSRPPSEEELQRSRQHLEAASDKVDGIRSLLWALLNTKEFIVNH